MNLKQCSKLLASAFVGASVAGFLVWRSAAHEHHRLMNLEMNKDYIDSWSNVDTGINISLTTKKARSSIEVCVNNTGEISNLDKLSVNKNKLLVFGWKTYLRQGTLVYLNENALPVQDRYPIFVCILNSDSVLESTRLIYPKLSGNAAVSIDESPSFLDVDI
jgi:hypothetical protein